MMQAELITVSVNNSDAITADSAVQCGAPLVDCRYAFKPLQWR